MAEARQHPGAWGRFGEGALGRGEDPPTQAPAPVPDQEGQESRFGLVPTGPPKLIPSLIYANLRRVGALGQEVHQSLGVIPTIDTAGEKK